MATSASPGKEDQPTEAGYESFTTLVRACNNFDGFELPEDHAYLCLPDSKSTPKIFGILQSEVLNTFQWCEHSFRATIVEEAKEAGVSIPKEITKGKVVIPDGLTPKGITEAFEKINKRYYDPYEQDKARVPLVRGHPDIMLPAKLSVYLGVLQIGVHLTIYHKDKEGVTHIHVQQRSESASYPWMLDQTVAGGLLHGESVREGLKTRGGRGVRQLSGRQHCRL